MTFNKNTERKFKFEYFPLQKITFIQYLSNFINNFYMSKTLCFIMFMTYLIFLFWPVIGYSALFVILTRSIEHKFYAEVFAPLTPFITPQFSSAQHL